MALSIREYFDKVSSKHRPGVGQAETSSNFDMDEVLPFLESLSILGEIYTPIGRLAFIAELIASMKHGETRCYEAVGGSQGEMHLLTIEVFIDDVDAPDIRFIGTEKMIALIDDKLMERG